MGLFRKVAPALFPSHGAGKEKLERGDIWHCGQKSRACRLYFFPSTYITQPAPTPALTPALASYSLLERAGPLAGAAALVSSPLR